ncbi:BatA and WFA domain-containing protein [Mucilaginibacter myungsuensis]
MFSNVQFLKELQEQQASRRNLKERLILVARLLAIFFLVLAFAKPFIPHNNSVAIGKQQIVSIFVDNSYSMQTLSKEGSLLDEAKRHAKEIAASYGINDRFQLLTQDLEGKHQRLLSRDEFDDAVDAVKISPQSRDLQQIVDRQESLIKTQGGTASIFLLSDFQSNMGKQSALKADSGVNLNLVQLKANMLPNVAIDSVWLLSAVHRPDENEKLVVRLHNYADQEAKRIPLKLSINGIQKAQGSFSLEPRAVQNDTLAFSGLKAGWQHGELVLQDNPITFDNKFDFTFNVKNQVPVLLINGGTTNQYLQAAFATDKFFVVNNTQDGNVDYARLSTYPLVVLSDVKAVSAGLAQQLKVYVDKGGSLVVFQSADADLNTYKALLQPLRAAYPSKLMAEATKVSSLNVQSKIFKNVFEQLLENPDLPVVKKYYQLTQPTQSISENIMSMAGNQPFFASYKSGAGQVYVSAVPLDEEFSNLPRHAMLLPILFRITLLSGHNQPLFYSVGKDEIIEAPPIQLNEKQVLKLVKGSNSIIPDARTQEGSTLLYISDQLKETGNYELKKQDSVLSVIAFNDNRRESDMSYLTETQLKTMAPGGNFINAATPSLKSELNNINIGLQLWKLFVVLALVCIAIEILLVRFYKVDRQVAAVTT